MLPLTTGFLEINYLIYAKVNVSYSLPMAEIIQLFTGQLPFPSKKSDQLYFLVFFASRWGNVTKFQAMESKHK